MRDRRVLLAACLMVALANYLDRPSLYERMYMRALELRCG